RCRVADQLGECPALVAGAMAAAALCCDTSGNGYFTASDALVTLTLAVTSGYDRRGDVYPAGGDGTISVTDALQTLKAVVGGSFPNCHGSNQTRALVSTSNSSSGGLAVIDAVGSIATRKPVVRLGALSQDSVV